MQVKGWLGKACFSRLVGTWHPVMAHISQNCAQKLSSADKSILEGLCHMISESYYLNCRCMGKARHGGIRDGGVGSLFTFMMRDF
jgi:hypothetical protein